MSAGNGVALILFGHSASSMNYRGGTRGGSSHKTRRSRGLVDDFEVFLDHCDFCLWSEHGSVVRLGKADTAGASGVRPEAEKLLPNVHEWSTVLSRYRFHVQDAEEAKLLQQEFIWTLKLRDIRTDDSLRTYDASRGEEYLTSVVCFPQSWLRWIDNAWFANNVEICWFMQRDDTFGVPSRASAEANEYSDCAGGRHYFRTCFVPNKSTTAVTAGTSAVCESSVALEGAYTDSEHGIVFPQKGHVYVILFDVPSEYAIERKEAPATRECVLCGDEVGADDAGLVFGRCGHYVCGGCCTEHAAKLNEVETCFYCRRKTSVCVDAD